MAHYYDKDEFRDYDWFGNYVGEVKNEPVQSEESSEDKFLKHQSAILNKHVDDFAKEMKTKLIRKSEDGWNSWQDCDIRLLEIGLFNAIKNNEYLDIANYSLLLKIRNEI